MFKKVDVCLFFKVEKVQEKSIQYFTGVHTDLGILLKFKRRQTLYLSSLEEVPKVKFTIKNFDPKKIFADIKRAKVKTIGLHYGELTKRSFDFLKKNLKGYKLIDVTDEITKLRSIKSNQEVKYLKKAIAITEKILLALEKKLPSFTYESQAIQFVQQEMITHNVVESFPTIVASGTNSKSPHYFPQPTSKLQRGFIIVDMGVQYKGYAADLTRTFYLGKPTREELDFYNKIKDEQFSLEKSIKVKDKKFKASFPMVHMLGHGIGLDVHEYPGLGYNELEEGMCLALEPAIYTKKYGVRIEDDYLLTKKGMKRLSNSSRELKILKRH